nr:MAG TPA: hypothetical protein [Caudoviricetes sp.]
MSPNKGSFFFVYFQHAGYNNICYFIIVVKDR